MQCHQWRGVSKMCGALAAYQRYIIDVKAAIINHRAATLFFMASSLSSRLIRGSQHVVA